MSFKIQLLSFNSITVFVHTTTSFDDCGWLKIAIHPSYEADTWRTSASHGVKAACFCVLNITKWICGEFSFCTGKTFFAFPCWIFCGEFSFYAGKTTAIRRVAAWETGVPRHQGDPNEGPPETPWIITALSYWGV